MINLSHVWSFWISMLSRIYYVQNKRKKVENSPTSCSLQGWMCPAGKLLNILAAHLVGLRHLTGFIIQTISKRARSSILNDHFLTKMTVDM